MTWHKNWLTVEDDKPTTYKQFSNPPEFYNNYEFWTDKSGKNCHRKKRTRRTGESLRKSIAIWLRGEGQNYIWGDFFHNLYKKGWGICCKWLPKRCIKNTNDRTKKKRIKKREGYRYISE